MHSKEDPEDLILLSPGLDLIQAVMLLLSSEATFHPRSPLFTQFSCNDLPMTLMLSSPTFAFEVRDDLVLGAPLPVSIGGINVVC